MAFYSQLFWVSMFMQQVENLNSFEVAVRLLPQALVGLLLSPLVGLFMHTVPGTALLAFAASALVLSNIFLIFLHHDGHYLFWIFPSIMLSTVGMDWVMNVGSVRLEAIYVGGMKRANHIIASYSIFSTTRPPFCRRLTSSNNKPTWCSTWSCRHYSSLVLLRWKGRLVPT